MKYTSIVFVVLFIGTIFSNWNDQKNPHILLDYVNYRMYDFFDLINTPSLYQRSLTYADDTSYSVENEYPQLPTVFSAWADLCSETGEPLFSRLAGESAQNREHGTHGGIWLQIPAIHLQLMGNYRHLGMYADRIEQYATHYAAMRNVGLQHTNTGDDGVGEFAMGKWILSYKSSRLKGVFTNFGRWTDIPGLYIPVYKEGNDYVQDISHPLLMGQIALSIDIIRQKYHADHARTISDNHFSFSTEYKQKAFENGFIALQAQSSTIHTSKLHGAISFTNTILDNTTALTLSAGIWSNIKPESQIKIAYSVTEKCTISAEHSYTYFPGEKGISIVSPSDTVTTNFFTSHSNNFSCVAHYENENRIPLTMSLWTRLMSRPQFLFVNTDNDRMNILFDVRENELLFSGGELNLRIPLKELFFSIWSRANVIITGKPFEYLPYDCGVSIGYTSPVSVPFIVLLKTTLRGPYTWNAKFNNLDTVASSPKTVSCDLHLEIPFTLPVFTSRVVPVLTIDAGPIPIYPQGRQKRHPFGNPIGPLISIRLQGNIINSQQ